MSIEPLPDDLRQIENEIADLMQLDMRADFGRRVVGAMQIEMRRERTASRWKFAMGVAAAAFFWLHLSFYAASVTNFHFDQTPPSAGNNSWSNSFVVGTPHRNFR